MPQFACGGFDNKPECSSEGSKTFPPQAMTCGQTKTRSTGYSTNCVAGVFEDASVQCALETSVTKLERASRSHCPTGFRISRKQGNHEPVDGIEERIGDVHIVSPTATFWPEQGAASNGDLGTKPKAFTYSQNRG